VYFFSPGCENACSFYDALLSASRGFETINIYRTRIILIRDYMH
jgi:hypothetical protein